ncbi:hypothetical protein C789_528 [Microcystis aeruginosa FACHB-905 = DIANCHI905]|uniref:Uncharacterized protein n=1 Tax=Microcystis aeruginosa PCC 7806SL TaxID=1903187 RepID=A0AB33BJF0_MICA7|nr:hypothetical protein BH695_1573 [Microcystis aeruginosa PCC 7806SL]ELS49691.1 hypothetical protein C789_528 [Microcystis aeruginosa FACHB-905 = DIANCHI905]
MFKFIHLRQLYSNYQQKCQTKPKYLIRINYQKFSYKIM